MKPAKHPNDEAVIPEEDCKPPAKRPRREAALKSEERIAEMKDVGDDDDSPEKRRSRRRKNEEPTKDAKGKTAEEVVKETQPPPDEEFNLVELLKYKDNFDDDTFRQVLDVGLIAHHHMIELILILRSIYYTIAPRRNKRVPIQIVLIISMAEWIVAFVKGACNQKDFEEYVMTFIRGQWKLVGSYINLGQLLSEKKVLHLFAFCVLECLGYKGTDDLDHMKPNNHTLKYSDCNILLDHLHTTGYNCTQDECRQFSSDHIMKMDGWIETGMVGKGGNKWDEYEEQLGVRFNVFCEDFKNYLQVVDGPSIIEETRYPHYRGVHIVAVAGLLNVGLVALLASEKSKRTPSLSVVVHSTRVREAFFQCKGDKFDVIQYKDSFISVHPFIHPNNHQQWLTTKEERVMSKLDKSYSEGHRDLDGVEINVKGAIETYQASLSSASSQRFALRNEVITTRSDYKSEDTAKEEAGMRRLKMLDRGEEREKKFKENQDKKKQMKKS